MAKIKTTKVNDLRIILSEEIDSIRKGNTTAANVNAITNATGKILSSARLEIEYSKILGKKPKVDFLE